MKNGQNEKLTFKMYKKGRFWVSAGIALATINLGTLAGQAATATPAPTKIPVTNEATVSASKLNQSQVTLKSGTTPTSVEANNESAVNSVQPKTPVTAPSAASPASSVPATQSATADKTATSSVAEPVGTPAPTVSTPESVAPAVDKTSQATPASATETKAAAVNQSARSVAAPTAAASTVVSQGTLQIDGGSDWTIDDTGLLTIHAGNVANITAAATQSWYDQRGTITKVVIDGPVKAGSNFSSVFSQRGTFSKKISSIEGLEKIDTSQATNMS